MAKVDFQNKICSNPCPECGIAGYIKSNGVGYSCPLVYFFVCERCEVGFSERDPDEESISAWKGS